MKIGDIDAKSMRINGAIIAYPQIQITPTVIANCLVLA